MHHKSIVVAALALVACGKPEAGRSGAASAPAPPDPPPAQAISLTGKPPASATSKNFTVDAAAPSCSASATCTLTLRLSALGDFHVNKEYPFKFSATAAPGVTFLGNGDANTFSRAAGDHKEEGEKAATMTIRFKPAAAGEAKVSGTYKMSVCSADICQLEQVNVQLAVPVL